MMCLNTPNNILIDESSYFSALCALYNSRLCKQEKKYVCINHHLNEQF